MKLRLQNFRNLADFSVEFQPGINLITGLNGSGKTSLVEAIYLCYQGKSWRSNFSEITRRGAEWWRVDLSSDYEKRIVKYHHHQKTFLIDEKSSKALPRAKKSQIILFQPEDTRILYGSPTRRRDFIDYFLSEIYPEYGENLRKYTRILRQRNKMLKTARERGQMISPDEWAIWDEQLARTAEIVIKLRNKCIFKINEVLKENYHKVVKAALKPTLKYQHKETFEELLSELNRHHERDLMMGVTSLGPHKHDIDFLIDGRSAAKILSRGEGKLLLLTIFLILIKEYGISRVIFDDLFNEIDLEKIKNLEPLLKDIPEVYITDCRLLDENFGFKIKL
jgi:DNA replication and repair protein RecF